MVTENAVPAPRKRSVKAETGSTSNFQIPSLFEMPGTTSGSDVGTY